jgi:hypothetical protein
MAVNLDRTLSAAYYTDFFHLEEGITKINRTYVFTGAQSMPL